MLGTPDKSLVPVFTDGKNPKNMDNQQETKSLLIKPSINGHE